MLKVIVDQTKQSVPICGWVERKRRPTSQDASQSEIKFTLILVFLDRHCICLNVVLKKLWAHILSYWFNLDCVTGCFFNFFAAAEPTASVCVAHRTLCNDPSVYIAATAYNCGCKFRPSNFCRFRRNPWQPFAEPWLKNTGLTWMKLTCLFEPMPTNVWRPLQLDWFVILTTIVCFAEVRHLMTYSIS